jgi:hypothetical protein
LVSAEGIEPSAIRGLEALHGIGLAKAAFRRFGDT